MRLALLTLLLFASAGAFAQISVQESDSINQLTIFGRKVNTNFFNVASVETDKVEDQGGRLATYSYFTFASYVAADYRMALRVPFQYNTAGTDRFNGGKVNEEEFFLQDVILGLQNYNLVYLPYDMEVYWEGRFYLPTSDHSKRTGLITRFRNEFILSRYINRHFEWELGQKFHYYFQSRAAYRNSFTDEDGFDVNVDSLTKRMEFEHVARLWGKITPEIAAGLSFGTEETYYNKSETLNKSKQGARYYRFGPQVRFPITNHANFILSYEDRVDRNDNASELGQFRAENTQVSLLSFIRF